MVLYHRMEIRVSSAIRVPQLEVRISSDSLTSSLGNYESSLGNSGLVRMAFHDASGIGVQIRVCLSEAHAHIF